MKSPVGFITISKTIAFIILQHVLLNRLKAWARAMSDADFEESEDEEIIEELTPDKLRTAQDIVGYLADAIYNGWYNGLINPRPHPGRARTSLFTTSRASLAQATSTISR